jgi:hypothetical protein
MLGNFEHIQNLSSFCIDSCGRVLVFGALARRYRIQPEFPLPWQAL